MTPETITYAAAAIGYGVGIGAEQYAIHVAGQKWDKLFEATGNALADQQANESSRSHHLTRWAASTIMAPLALGLGVAAGVETHGWVGNAEQEQAKPVVEVVVDHSGATSLPFDGKPSVLDVNKLAKAFNSDKFKGTAIVASTGTIKEVPFNDVSKDTPAGNAPLDEAISLALDQAIITHAAGNSSNTGPESSVVVITNGNSIGNTDTVIGRAKQAAVPLYVVNVDSTQTSPKVKADLRRTATATHGKYWEANGKNLQDVAATATEHLSPHHEPSKQPTDWPDRIFGAIGLLGAAMYFRKRSSYALGKGPKGE